MSTKQFLLLNMLCEQIGIKTLGELNEFKNKTKVKTNDALLSKLALFVEFKKSLCEVLETN